jgi:hypothetical protein
MAAPAFAATAAFGLVLGLASASAAQESSTVADARTLCIANHAVADKVMAAADAQGWSPPPGDTSGVTRQKTVGADTRLLVAKSVDGPVAGADGMHVDVCVMQHKTASGDVKESAKALVGGQTPIVDEHGNWVWVFTQSGGTRRFLADKNQPTLLAALKDGPVTVLAAGSDSDGDTVAYVVIGKATAGALSPGSSAPPR